MRQRRPEDENDLTDLISRIDAERPWWRQDPIAARDIARGFLLSRVPGSLEITACVAGKVVGYAGAYPFLEQRQSHTAEITICVATEFQRRGIGGMLIACLIKSAWVMMEATRLQLTVFVDNTAAHAFYLRWGFRTEGRIANFIRHDSGYADAFLMALLKASPPAAGGEAGAS